MKKYSLSLVSADPRDFVFAMKGFVKNILNFPMMEPEIAVMAENVSKIP